MMKQTLKQIAEGHSYHRRKQKNKGKIINPSLRITQSKLFNITNEQKPIIEDPVSQRTFDVKPDLALTQLKQQKPTVKVSSRRENST
jgi:hypothetical protein